MGSDSDDEKSVPRKIVHAFDSAYVKLGELLRLPSATPPAPEKPLLPATLVDLPGGRKAHFKLCQLKGEYFFEERASLYKAELKLGPSVVCCLHQSNRSVANYSPPSSALTVKI